MTRARPRALSHDETLAVLRRSVATPEPAEQVDPPTCACHRCLLNALAELHRDFEQRGWHDAADAVAEVLHQRTGKRTLAKLAQGRLRCKQGGGG